MWPAVGLSIIFANACFAASPCHNGPFNALSSYAPAVSFCSAYYSRTFTVTHKTVSNRHAPEPSADVESQGARHAACKVKPASVATTRRSSTTKAQPSGMHHGGNAALLASLRQQGSQVVSSFCSCVAPATTVTVSASRSCGKRLMSVQKPATSSTQPPQPSRSSSRSTTRSGVASSATHPSSRSSTTSSSSIGTSPRSSTGNSGGSSASTSAATTSPATSSTTTLATSLASTTSPMTTTTTSTITSSITATSTTTTSSGPPPQCPTTGVTPPSKDCQPGFCDRRILTCVLAASEALCFDQCDSTPGCIGVSFTATSDNCVLFGDCACPDINSCPARTVTPPQKDCQPGFCPRELISCSLTNSNTECQQACDNDPTFRCVGLNYNPDDDSCRLYGDCTCPPLTCSTVAAPALQKDCQPGTCDRSVLRCTLVNSQAECQSACDASDLGCIGFNYDATTEECILYGDCTCPALTCSIAGAPALQKDCQPGHCDRSIVRCSLTNSQADCAVGCEDPAVGCTGISYDAATDRCVLYGDCTCPP